MGAGVRAQRATKPPSRAVEGSWLGPTARAPQPAPGLPRLLPGVRGLATVGPRGPPYSTSVVVPVVEVRARRARNHHSSCARFRGSGLAALAPQPARGRLLSFRCRRLVTVGPGGPPTRPTGWIRWLRCERSEPRNHPAHRRLGFVARAWRPARLDHAGCCRLSGVRGLATGRPWGASLLDQRDSRGG